MTGRITHHETPPHQCTPGWETRPGQDLLVGAPREVLFPVYCMPGDIWTCDCGLRWFAYYPKYVINGGQLDLKWMPYVDVQDLPKREHWWQIWRDK